MNAVRESNEALPLQERRREPEGPDGFSSDGLFGRRATAAFTLIELMGVLVVIAILAAVLFPVLIQAFDRVAREREDRTLATMGNALRELIQRRGIIPDHNTVASNVASQLGWRTNDVLFNARRLRRVYLFDPDSTFRAQVPIPFVQGVLGVLGGVPLNSGAIILSSVSQPLPAGLVSGPAASHADFMELWDMPEGQVPGSWGWGGNGDDLRMERISFGTLFVPLTLNYDTWTVKVGGVNQGLYTIGPSALTLLPPWPTNNTYTANYLRGTVLGLHGHNGDLQVQQIMLTSASFVYELAAWRGQLFLGRGFRPTIGIDIQGAHDATLASPTNPGTKFGATPVGVLLSLSNYMVTYTNWASLGFPRKAASYTDVKDAQAVLEKISFNLIQQP